MTCRSAKICLCEHVKRQGLYCCKPIHSIIRSVIHIGNKVAVRFQYFLHSSSPIISSERQHRSTPQHWNSKIRTRNAINTLNAKQNTEYSITRSHEYWFWQFWQCIVNGRRITARRAQRKRRSYLRSPPKSFQWRICIGYNMVYSWLCECNEP